MIKKLWKNKFLSIPIALAVVAVSALLVAVGYSRATGTQAVNIAPSTTITTNAPAIGGSKTSALVDNVVGKDSARYKIGWFDTTKTFDYYIDFAFDSIYRIDEVEIDYQNPNDVPAEYSLEAYDGEKWIDLGEPSITSDLWKWSVGSDVDYTKLRFNIVRVRTAGVFLDEVRIMATASNVAKGAEPTFDSVLPDRNPYLTDGNANTWAATKYPSSDTTTKEIYLTLQKAARIDEILIYPRMVNGQVNAFPVDFQVCVYDGNEWRVVANETSISLPDAKPFRAEFEAINGSAIRIVVTKLGQEKDGYSVHLGEIEAYGTVLDKVNIEKPNIVLEASNIAPSSEAELAADGKSVTYTFDKAYKVNEVVFERGITFPSKFNIAVWDGVKWQKVDSRNSATFLDSRLYVSIEAMDCRALRITSEDNNKNVTLLNKESEIIIHGTVADSNIKTPGEMQDKGVNAALNSNVFMNVPQNEAYGLSFPATMLVDGTKTGNNFATTKYTTDAIASESVIITFADEKAYELNKIKLFPRVRNNTYQGGFPDAFKLSVWNGIQWVEIASMSGYKVDTDPISFALDPIVCNTVKLEVTRLGKSDNSAQPYVLQLAEIEAWGIEKDTIAKAEFGENAALGGSVDMVTPSAAWAEKYQKEKLVDDILVSHDHFATTVYSKEEDKKEDIKITFKDNAAYTIERIKLFPRVKDDTIYGFPVDFTVSVWNGTEWIVVDTKKDYVATKDALNIELDTPTVCNGVKVEVTKLGTSDNSSEPYVLQLAEIQAWGEKSDQTLKEPDYVEYTGVNATLSGTVEMNVAEFAKDSLPAENLVDGTSKFTTTTYVKDANTKESATVIFKEGSYEIDKIVLSPRLKSGTVYGFPVDFEISVWDGTQWVSVATKTGCTSDGTNLELSITPTLCNAVKIDVTKQGESDNVGQYAVQLAEFEAWGQKSDTVLEKPKDESAPGGVPGEGEPGENEPGNTHSGVNAALKGTVEMVVAPFAVETFPAVNLVDGTSKFTTTTYVKDAKTKESMTVVFKEGTYEIDTIVLSPRIKGDTVYGFPVDFELSVWNGTKWVSIATKTGCTSDGKNLELKITPTLCNALKIDVTKQGESDNAGQYAVQLAEIEAWGEKSEVTLVKPNEGSKPGDSEEKPGNTHSGINAALKGTVEMVVAPFAVETFPAVNLVDGTSKFTTTTYVKDAKTKESMTVVFKEGAYEIDTIVLSPRIKGDTVYGFPVDFELSVWNGTKWVSVATKTGCTSDGKNLELKITPTLCNALKIDVTKQGESDNAGQYAVQLAELEAWGEKSSATLSKPSKGETVTEVKENGTNAALDGTVSMNIPKWATSFPGSQLVNGLTVGDNDFATTEYVSDANTKDSIMVVFKDGSYEVNKIKLFPRVKGNAYNGGFPVDFKVSVWNGTKWVEVASKTGVAKNTAEAVSLSIQPTVCNALKIDVTKMGESENQGKFTLQLAEIEAWGEKSSEKLAMPPALGAVTDSGISQVTIDNTKNLALNRPAKASSDLSQYGAPVLKVNDGNLNSYWASNDTKFVKGEAQWVEINLLNNFSIHTVILGARQEALGFPYDFKVEIFYDGEWKEAYSVKGFEANEKAGYTAYEFKFPAVIGNKIRVSSDNFRKVGSSNSLVFTEVAVYGDSVSGNYVLPNENMITSGTAITSTTSMEDYDYYLVHLIDGNLTTGWSCVPQTAADSVQTVEVDMKGEVQLSEIQLKPSWGGHGFPIDFTISVLENGKWVDVYEAKDYEKPEDEAIQRFQFETKKVSKFRITVTKMDEEAGLYVWKMNEIMAYPSHTGDEFDPNRVDEVNSSEKLVAAEVITPDGDIDETLVDVQLWKIIVGGILFLMAVGGCVTILIFLKKKNNKQ